MKKLEKLRAVQELNRPKPVFNKDIVVGNPSELLVGTGATSSTAVMSNFDPSGIPDTWVVTDHVGEKFSGTTHTLAENL